jgi:hypothetical protein
MASGLESWTDFNVALAGAAAALAGLVIVASSVNIAEIIKSSTLTARLAAGIAALVLAIVVSGTGLIPEIEPVWYGAVIVGATAIAAAFQVHATRVIVSDPNPEARVRFLKSALGFVPIVCYLAAGITLLLAHPAGLVLAAAGALVAIVAAIVVSWVALVEVLR